MDKIHKDFQAQCISVVDPQRPELFYRKYNSDPGRFYIEADVDYNPRNPKTFEDDASFYMISHGFFFGYYAFHSVDMPYRYTRLTPDGRIAVDEFECTEAFRNEASWTGYNFSTQCTFTQTFSISS